MRKLITFSLIFLMGTTLVSPGLPAQEGSLKRLMDNYRLLNTDPEKAFQEAKRIEKEAGQTNKKEEELWAIHTQFTYYKMDNDFENMMTSSKLLLKKATDYGLPTYQAMAKTDLSYVYLLNKLPEDALQQLDEGLKITKNIKERSPLQTIVKSNLYLSYFNFYIIEGDSYKSIDYVKMSIEEIETLSDAELKQIYNSINYVNLAYAYMAIQQYHQAKHYANLSLSSNGNDDINHRTDAELLALIILGKVSNYEKDYKTALHYYTEAQKLENTQGNMNLRELYNRIIDCYRHLNDQRNIKLYEAKRDSLSLAVSENQNKFLHNLLIENAGKRNDTLLYALISALLLMILISSIIIRKNRILARQERASQKYLDEISEPDKTQAYSVLLGMLKENVPEFMLCFNETFPEFSSKLQKLNAKICLSDIEFCALLKLKIPTKDIARYKFIEPTTVRNKKYLIRKKLHIPNDMDIYQWFDSF